MKLHMFPFAPNPAKVRLYLAEKAELGCEVPLEEVTVNLLESEQKSEAFLAKNPRGTLPVLELEDGTCLCESLAIIEFFETTYPSPSMWGDDPVRAAYARQIERIADIGVLINTAREIHASNSPLGLPANPPVAEYFAGNRAKAVAHLESEMADGRPFLAGDRPTVGDCTLQAILQFARFREVDVLEDAPRLREWCDRYRERPAAKKTILL
ncbi:MAG: glutathione S-transferase family protein [bacterium]|nr:glutathione S-transferase family protein [bacterium]